MPPRSRLAFSYQFRHSEVLDRHTVRRTLRYPGGTVKIRVPDATSLFFLKAKAFAGRLHCSCLSTHADASKRLKDDVQKLICAETVEYWAAQAAKDMDGLAFLSRLPLSKTRLAKLLADPGRRRNVVVEWARCVPELYEVAARIRDEAGEPAGFVASRYEAVLGLLA